MFFETIYHSVSTNKQQFPKLTFYYYESEKAARKQQNTISRSTVKPYFDAVYRLINFVTWKNIVGYFIKSVQET